MRTFNQAAVRELAVIAVLAATIALVSVGQLDAGFPLGEAPFTGQPVEAGLGAFQAGVILGNDHAAADETAAIDSPAQHQAYGELRELELEVPQGHVRIEVARPGDKPSARWQVRPVDAPNAAGADSVEVKLQESRGKLAVQGTYTGPAGLIQPDVDLVVSLPASADISANLGYGTLSIAGGGTVEAKVGTGSLLLNGSFDASQAHVENGSLSADMLLDSGQHALDVEVGKLEVQLRKGSDVSYTARASEVDFTAGVLPATYSLPGPPRGAPVSGTLGSGAASLALSCRFGEIGISIG